LSMSAPIVSFLGAFVVFSFAVVMVLPVGKDNKRDC
jgi:hypothetical protein